MTSKDRQTIDDLKAQIVLIQAENKRLREVHTKLVAQNFKLVFRNEDLKCAIELLREI